MSALPARADDGGGAAVECVGANTYQPRGDHWALLPTASIPVLFQPDGPTQPAATALPGATANQAIQAAFNTWTSAQCAQGGRPNVRLSIGSYPTRDRGDNGLSNAYQHVIYFVTPGTTWEADAMTVALTTNLYETDNQFSVDADMEFNNINFNWRVGSTGCNVADGNCYDVQTVALHEAGHFLGFNHVSCTDAVMFPSAYGAFVNSVLSHHEAAGICALYPPRTSTNTSISEQGEGCNTQGDCNKGLDCVFAKNISPANPNGWCAKQCSSTADCGNAYVCGLLDGYPSLNYCHPGFHLPDVPVANVGPASDLCASCTDGSQCSTGLCGGQDSQGNGLCTQTCSAPGYACPDDFECAPTTVSGRSVCLPAQTDTCLRRYNGVILNDTCFEPSTTANPNGDFNRVCAPGLDCFSFTSGQAACVQACNSTDPTMQCDAGFHCCYGVDSQTGACLGVAPTRSTGGCFQDRQAGDSCVLANQSVCSSTTSCFTPGAAEDARCYNFCDSGSCGASEICVNNAFSNGNNGALAVCCDVSKWDPKNLATCVPHAAPCLRQESVACNNNGDCASGYCLKLATGAVCSVNCASDADCTAAGIDVNDDGVADGGSHCDASAGNHCVPNAAPAVAPACAAPTTAAAKQGCGGCAQGGGMGFDGLAWGVVLGICILRGARRRSFGP